MKNRLIKIYILLISLFLKEKKRRIILTFNNEDMMFNTKYLFEDLIINKKFKDKKYEIKYIINNDNKKKELKEKYKGDFFISNKTIADKLYILKSKVWITDGNFPIITPFSHKNRVLINLWHGIPLKNVGLNGYQGLKKIKVKLMLKCFTNFYSCFSVTSEKLKKIINGSFLIPYEKIKVMGQVRNDMLSQNKTGREALDKFFVNLTNYEKVALYAPTWREGPYGTKWKYGDTVFFPFPDFNEKKLNKFLSDNKILLVLRPHHLQKINLKESDWIKTLGAEKVQDIMEIMNIFDCVITDYSSIYFDFLLLNRPLIFIPYDLELYEKEIGFNFKYEEVTPGLKVLTQKKFLEELLEMKKNPFRDSEKREKINNEFNEVKFGALELLIEYIEKSIGEKL